MQIIEPALEHGDESRRPRVRVVVKHGPRAGSVHNSGLCSAMLHLASSSNDSYIGLRSTTHAAKQTEHFQRTYPEPPAKLGGRGS